MDPLEPAAIRTPPSVARSTGTQFFVVVGKIMAILVGGALCGVGAVLIPCMLADGGLPQCSLGKTQHSQQVLNQVFGTGFLAGAFALVVFFFALAIRRAVRDGTWRV